MMGFGTVAVVLVTLLFVIVVVGLLADVVEWWRHR